MQAARIFHLELSVEEADIDPLGHASNISFVRWIQDVAVAHSDAVGLSFEAYRRLGAVFVVVRHVIEYVRPALRGDRLEARTWISSVMAAKCLRSTEIARRSDGRVLARGETTWGFVDLTTGRPTRIPAAVRGAFADFLPGADEATTERCPSSEKEFR